MLDHIRLSIVGLLAVTQSLMRFQPKHEPKHEPKLSFHFIPCGVQLGNDPWDLGSAQSRFCNPKSHALRGLPPLLVPGHLFLPLQIHF